MEASWTAAPEATPAAGAGLSQGLEPWTFQVTPVAEPEAASGPMAELAKGLPFRALGIAPPQGYRATAEGRTLVGGAWTVRVDLEKLRRYVTATRIRVPLPAARATVDVEIRGGAALVAVWRALDSKAVPLILVQIQMPRLTAPPELDLERVTQALLREVTPPILWRRSTSSSWTSSVRCSARRPPIGPARSPSS
ncbi:MAG: hypothetical protein FJ029_12590 [Actinobacteria bacterium]|nr:hypothetical protein [Actinomycetota bacterium]